MWIIFAAGSAVFAALTAILAKLGVKETDSNTASAVRTGVVLVFSWVMILITGEIRQLSRLSEAPQELIWLVLSGLATGGSWLCYFRAIRLGSVNRVAPIDKSSALLSVLAAFVIFSEPITPFKLLGTALMAAGLLCGVVPEKNAEKTEGGERGWLFFAVLSAVFAALSSILAKVGMVTLGSNAATAVRTVVVLAMSWIVVAVTRKKTDGRREPVSVAQRDLLFIILSGFATGASWLCYFKALRYGDMSVVVVLDKMSLPITVGLSFLLLREKPGGKSLAATVLITLGALSMLI